MEGSWTDHNVDFRLTVAVPWRFYNSDYANWILNLIHSASASFLCYVMLNHIQIVRVPLYRLLAWLLCGRYIMTTCMGHGFYCMQQLRVHA